MCCVLMIYVRSLEAAIYIKWVEASAGGGNRQHLCDSLNLSLSGMRDMMQLVNQYDSSLKAAGYLASDDADRNMRSWRIIRSCVVAALAPSQLVRVVRPSTKYAQTVEGAVERDAVAKELKVSYISSLFFRPLIYILTTQLVIYVESSLFVLVLKIKGTILLKAMNRRNEFSSILARSIFQSETILALGWCTIPLSGRRNLFFATAPSVAPMHCSSLVVILMFKLKKALSSSITGLN